MTDRELLEMAAKAAGLILMQVPNANQTDADWWSYSNTSKPNTAKAWNPLIDDGDALRLAVKLGLFNDEDFFAELKAIWMYSCTDYYAATRRAIVLAAAEMSKSIA